MARKVLNRRELRKEAEAAGETAEAAPKKAKKPTARKAAQRRRKKCV